MDAIALSPRPVTQRPTGRIDQAVDLLHKLHAVTGDIETTLNRIYPPSGGPTAPYADDPAVDLGSLGTLEAGLAALNTRLLRIREWVAEL